MIKSAIRPLWHALKRVAKAWTPRKFANDVWISDLNKIREGKPIRVAFDIGANCGQTINEFIELMPEAHIHSFEPIGSLAEELTVKFKDNQRVTISKLAVAEITSNLPFHINLFNETSSLLEADNRSEYAALMEVNEQVIVPSTTISAYMFSGGIDFIDVVKIDAQGYELKILEGSTDSLISIGAIYAEVLFGRCYKNQSEFFQLDALLRNNGFWLFNFYNKNFGDDGRLVYADALWINERTRPESR
jgi:FkbM family methyltransferase